MPIKKKLAAWNAIVANSGIDGLDELKVTEEEMQEVQTQTVIPATDETAAEETTEQPVEDGVQVIETPVEPQEDAEPSIVSELRQIGTPEDLIAEVPSMIEKGFTEEEIIASIMGVIQKEEDK